MRHPLGRRLFAGLLLACLLLAACGGDDDSGPSSTRKGTAVPTLPPTQVPATALPSPSASNPFRGDSRVNDAGGDVSGSGEAPPGIDLTGVRVVPSEDQLVIIWYTAQRAERTVPDGATASWTVALSNGDIPAYDITFKVSGKEWDILVLDHATGEETKHRIGSIYNDRLDVPYPASKLDNLQPTFTWTAASSYTDATGATWTDTVPDQGSASFPG
ncbi:MAG TPA: hypothetical protein VFV93_04970 [Thermomicrobiales bacterium]|nr:hypothetical protein [Thermomicrobiales bacterium]